MTTKLLALVLVAGGAMFAQIRFSPSISGNGNTRGYVPQTAPYTYAQQHNTYQAQPYQQPSYNGRNDTGYANQGYARGSDAYGRQAYAGSYNQNQHQNVDRDDDRDDHDRSFNRDDHDRRKGDSQTYRQQSGYLNGFRNR